MKNVAVLVSIVLIPVLAYWILVYLLGVNRGGLICFVPPFILLPIVVKFLCDNFKIMNGNGKKFFYMLPKAIVALVPILIVSAPGIFMICFLETQAYNGANRCHDYCQDKISEKTEQKRQEVQKVREESAVVVWNPWTWGKKVKVYYKEFEYTWVKNTIITPAKMSTKFLYGSVVAILDIVVICSRIMIGTMILLSFLYIYSQILICKTKLQVRF